MLFTDDSTLMANNIILLMSKVRQSLTATATLLGESGKEESLSKLADAYVECEGPNKKLYDFSGSLTLKGKEASPLSTAQVGQRKFNKMSFVF